MADITTVTIRDHFTGQAVTCEPSDIATALAGWQCPRGLVALVQQVINEHGARCPVSQFAGCATHSGQQSQVGVDNLDVRAMKQ